MRETEAALDDFVKDGLMLRRPARLPVFGEDIRCHAKSPKAWPTPPAHCAGGGRFFLVSARGSGSLELELQVQARPVALELLLVASGSVEALETEDEVVFQPVVDAEIDPAAVFRSFSGSDSCVPLC